MPALNLLRDLIQRVPARLERLPQNKAETKPAPTAWSPKEELGHLVDSAANNHQRIVRGQSEDKLAMPGYDQIVADHEQLIRRRREPTWLTDRSRLLRGEPRGSQAALGGSPAVVATAFSLEYLAASQRRGFEDLFEPRLRLHIGQLGNGAIALSRRPRVFLFFRVHPVYPHASRSLRCAR